MHSFTGDNILSSLAKIIENQISVLESESKLAINLFKTNHIIVTIVKFEAIIFDKRDTKFGDTKSICSLTGKLETKCGLVGRKKIMIFSIEISIKIKPTIKLNETKYLLVIE